MLKEIDVDDVVLLKVMSRWSRVGTKALMSAVNFKRTKFYNCINKLIKLGLVSRVLTGEYQLTEQGRLLAEKLVDLHEVHKILNGEGEPLKLKASNSELEVRNLRDFKNVVNEVENESLYQQVRTGNLSRWLYSIGDKYLSREVSKLRSTITRSNVKEKLKELVEKRVSFLEELLVLAGSMQRDKV
ncbi:MAG: hypothetical protein QW701_03670 [Candidatus Nezhaarchaeales archaeon]